MGRTDHRRALVVTDVGAEGRVLRQTRLELLFAAKEKNVETSVQHGLIMPFDTNRFFIDYRYQYYRPPAGLGETLSQFSGQIPNRFKRCSVCGSGRHSSIEF